MAALRGEMQMIDGQGKFFYPETESFVQGLPQKSLYSVISIIGPQSSGKSYLLNSLFGTHFEVLNARERNGRRQTTKGIWMAKCNKPCMIIMDVEGMDGMENKGKTLFERQSALFALAISDVMMLNMWYHDIGRRNGASLDLIKLIFQERVKMDAPITEIIIVVRDHDYDELEPIQTDWNVRSIITELWNEVHGSTRTMSDYIKVTVKDFPPKRVEETFARKCQDLQNLLQTAATVVSHAPSFAYRSKMIWDKILRNEFLIASDEKLAMSTHVCHIIMNNTLISLDSELEYKSLMKRDTTIQDFSRILNSFVTRLLEWYDDATVTYDGDTRKDIRDELESRIVQKFEKTFYDKADDLIYTMLKEVESTIPARLESLEELESSAISGILMDYGQEFLRRLSIEDLHPILKWRLEKYVADFVMGTTKIAEIKATTIMARRMEAAMRQAEMEAAKMKAALMQAEMQAEGAKMEKKSLLVAGAKACATIAIGTAWAASTFDPSLLVHGIATAASAVGALLNINDE